MTARRAEAAAALAAAAIAAVLVIVGTASNGPRISPDSVLYLSAADSFRAGDGFTIFDGNPLTSLPPGLSAAIAALGGIVGSDVLGARILNAICAALIVLAGWMLLRRHVASPALRVAGLVGLAGSSALLYVGTSVWSEPLFIALMLASILALELELERPGGWRWVAAAGLLAGAAFTVRYSGMWLVATGAVVLLAANRQVLTVRELLRRSVLFAGVALIVPAAIVARNLDHADGRPFGGRGPSVTPLDQGVSETAAALGRWLVPEDETFLLVALPAGALAALVAFVAARRGRVSEAAEARAPLWPLGLLAAAYLVFLLASGVTAYLDPIGPRLLAPVFVPLLVLTLAALDRLLARPLPRRTVVTAISAGVLVAWLGGQVLTTGAEFDTSRAGDGYNAARYRDSELLAMIRRRGITPEFSNYIDVLYFRSGVRSACWPNPVPSHCGSSPPDLDRIPQGRPALLAWRAEPGRHRPLVPAAVRSSVRLTLVQRVADGGLYRVVKR